MVLKMAKFHYIWMGRSPIDSEHENAFKEGPNGLARQLNELAQNKDREPGSLNPLDQEIIMWVPEALILNINNSGALDPNITLKPIEYLYGNARHLSKEERVNLKETVNLLGKYCAYAAQKDILSAAVLEEYGGYFLDTTTQVDSIESLTKNRTNEVWFPRISDEAGTTYDGSMTIIPDIWALYNPNPGEGTFKGMVDSYIQRCQYYFPDHFNIDKFDEIKIEFEDGTEETKTGYQFGDSGTGPHIMVSGSREYFIGVTAIHSFLDGLYQKRGDLTDEIMKQLSSLSTSTTTVEGEEKGKEIRERGIQKKHAGLWRDQQVVQGIEERSVRQNLPHRTPRNVEDRAEEQQQTKNRFHAFKVEASSFRELKTRYQGMKGDALKQKILSSLQEKLKTIHDVSQLDHYVKDFKASEDYKVLTTPQGVISRIFQNQTDNKRQVESILQKKKQALFEIAQELQGTTREGTVPMKPPYLTQHSGIDDASAAVAAAKIELEKIKSAQPRLPVDPQSESPSTLKT